ncbi:MAG: hypothetical protein NZ518_09800, partial [Dehalococcoidia bacterium]|nr:hypothetical protein [Dehalococcoidia bacterium]
MGLIVADDGTSVRAMALSDHGATASSWTTVATASGAIAAVAAAQRHNGDRAAFWVDGLTLRAARQVGGGWSAPSSSPLVLSSVSGLSATWDNDWIIVVTGTDPTGRATIWACRWGDDGALPAGVWESARVVTTADAGSGTEYRAPFVLAGQVAGQPLRLTYNERFAGPPVWSASMTTHQYPLANFFTAVWREGWPLPTHGPHGVALAIAPTTMWLSRPGEVWQAPTPSLAGVEIGGRVLSARWEERAGVGPSPSISRCVVELANPDGALTSTILPGGSLEIVAGYRVGAVDDVPGPPWATYWIEDVRAQRTATGVAVIVARGVDVVGVLARWRAPRQSVWNGSRSVAVLISQIAGWAGLNYNPRDPSPALVTTKPQFTLPPGESALSATQRLFALVPDVLRADGDALSS